MRNIWRWRRWWGHRKRAVRGRVWWRSHWRHVY